MGGFSVLSQFLAIEDIMQIFIQLPVRVGRNIDRALQTLRLLPSPFDYLQQSLSVVRNWRYDFHDIIDQLLFDDLIQHKLFLQRRRRVDFEQPALEVRIQEDIIPKQFETVGVLRNGVHASYQRLQDYLLNLPLYLLPSYPILLHPLP